MKERLRVNLTTHILTFLFLVALSPLSKAEDPVYFADANLKAAVESRLGVIDPTPTDMLGLTSLSVRQGGIIDLTGLETAANVIELLLDRNQISDLTALSGLTNLNGLLLDSNQISDFSPLSGLTSLVILELYDNQINDISALSGLMNLSLLDLNQNPLNNESYCTYLPLIQENNPGIALSYDPGNGCVVTGDGDGDGDSNGTSISITRPEL